MTFEEAKNFLMAWWSSETFDEVCQKLGMDKRTVSNHRANFVKQGVMMKKLKRKEVLMHKKKILSEAEWVTLRLLSRRLRDDEDQRRRVSEYNKNAQELREKMSKYDQVNQAGKLPGA